MKAIASASRRVFSVFSTAPHIGTPKCASYHLRDVGQHDGDGVAAADPRFASAEASRRQRA